MKSAKLERKIGELKAGNGGAFDYIYGQTNRTVYFAILYIVRDKMYAEDLLQETYVRAIRSIDSYREGTNFTAWLARIGKNLALNHVKAAKREVATDFETDAWRYGAQETELPYIFDAAAKILSERLSLPVYYESVEGNKVLPLFYKASQEEKERNRYSFLLQLSFLSNRYGSIRKALMEGNAILDRSIYEDSYFASRNHDLGNISDLEMEIYDNLLDQLLLALKSLPKKAPDVMVYLKGSFDTVLKRIAARGRSFELGEELVSYYHFLWEDYDRWVMDAYKASPIIVLDVDKVDIQENPKDLALLLEALQPYRK